MQKDPELTSTMFLLRQAAQGGRTEQGELFARYLPRLRQRALPRLRRFANARMDEEDLFQEALTEAYRALADFRGTTAAEFDAWFLTIVDNKAKDALRHGHAHKRDRRRERPMAELAPDGGTSTGTPNLPSPQATPTQEVRAQELASARDAAMAALSARHRRVIELRDTDGLSHAEIRDQMQLDSEEAARALYHRAHVQLARQLARFNQGTQG